MEAVVISPRQLITIVGWSILVTFVGSTVAGAQVASSFCDLGGSLHGGERLRITDKLGSVMNGRLIDLSDQSLRLMVRSAPVEVAEASLAKIERLASNARRGAWLGLIMGAVVGSVAVALSHCEDPFGCSIKRAAILPVAGISAGMGAGIGAGIGAMSRTGRVVYLAPE
jgi:hypothetical protein